MKKLSHIERRASAEMSSNELFPYVQNREEPQALLSVRNCLCPVSTSWSCSFFGFGFCWPWRNISVNSCWKGASAGKREQKLGRATRGGFFFIELQHKATVCKAATPLLTTIKVADDRIIELLSLRLIANSWRDTSPLQQKCIHTTFSFLFYVFRSPKKDWVLLALWGGAEWSPRDHPPPAILRSRAVCAFKLFSFGDLVVWQQVLAVFRTCFVSNFPQRAYMHAWSVTFDVTTKRSSWPTTKSSS